MVDISQRQQRLSTMPSNPSNPLQQHILRTENLTLDSLISQSFAIKTALLAPSLIDQLLDYYSWTCTWLTQMAQADDPMIHNIPESLVSNFQEFFTFLGRFARNVVTESQHKLQGILRFMVTFMAGKYALKNPHLRGQFPEIIQLFLPETHVMGAHLDGTLIVTDPFLQQHLMTALVELYVKVEYGDDQFYDKFNTRHHISQILKQLWGVPFYKAQLIQTAQDPKKIELFTNAIINDLMFLLDESLSNLNSIREYEQLRDNPDEWMAMPQQDRAEREHSHRQTERSCQSLMRLANATVHMIYYITKDTITPFVSEGFGERTAHIIDYYIDELVGPTVTNLKVKNPTKYDFHPRTLLAEIVQIFTHLSANETFVRSVALDDSHYKPDVYAKALRTVSKKRILDEATCARFQTALVKVAEMAEVAVKEEEELGEIPDDFLDPLTAALMTDPVILPSSKTTLDRYTIKRHLMNNPLDPFNRAPLSFDQVVPDTELKRRIDEWLAQKRAENKNKSTESKVQS